MKTKTVRIVNLGRGPQLEGRRLTVMDVFYYLHRGYDFDFIHRAMPSLAREDFDAIIDYVKDHLDELVFQSAPGPRNRGNVPWVWPQAERHLGFNPPPVRGPGETR